MLRGGFDGRVEPKFPNWPREFSLSPLVLDD